MGVKILESSYRKLGKPREAGFPSHKDQCHLIFLLRRHRFEMPLANFRVLGTT